jgi:hypothetical protein
MSAQETTPGQVFSTYGGLDGVDDLEASNWAVVGRRHLLALEAGRACRPAAATRPQPGLIWWQQRTRSCMYYIAGDISSWWAIASNFERVIIDDRHSTK